MKRNILSLISVLALIVISACGNKQQENSGDNHISPDVINNPATASGEKQDENLPAFEFEESNFDFGTINSGDVVTHEFKFKNSGNADLVISEAAGSCGCTKPEYPKQPLKPGEEGTIKVTFHSEGMAGQIAKTVTILANTIPSTKVLTISAEVLKKK